MPRHPRSYHYRHRPPVYMGRYPAALPLLFVLLAVSGVAGMGVLLALVVIGAGVVGPIALTGAVLVRNRRTAALRDAAAQRRPARRVPAPPRWQDAQNRFATLRTEYAGFECDPVQVLTLPALADVSVPSTERFVEAFSEAQALDTDTEPSANHSAAYVAAVDRACRAWTAAKDAAERIRLSRLDAAERACVQRVIKLLAMAQDTDNDAERLTAYGRARSELLKLERAGTVLLPHPAHAALDAACRGELPAGSYGRVEP
jgi:hypothetical protein